VQEASSAGTGAMRAAGGRAGGDTTRGWTAAVTAGYSLWELDLFSCMLAQRLNLGCRLYARSVSDAGKLLV
jgi:hypothetical protein